MPDTQQHGKSRQEWEGIPEAQEHLKASDAQVSMFFLDVAESVCVCVCFCFFCKISGSFY